VIGSAGEASLISLWDNQSSGAQIILSYNDVTYDNDCADTKTLSELIIRPCQRRFCQLYCKQLFGDLVKLLQKFRPFSLEGFSQGKCGSFKWR